MSLVEPLTIQTEDDVTIDANEFFTSVTSNIKEVVTSVTGMVKEFNISNYVSMELPSQFMSNVSSKLNKFKLNEFSSYKYPLLITVGITASFGVIYSIKCYSTKSTETFNKEVENNENNRISKNQTEIVSFSNKTLSLHNLNLELYCYLQTSFLKIEEIANQIVKEKQKRSDLFSNFLKIVVDNSQLEMNITRRKFNLEKNCCQWMMVELPVLFLGIVSEVIRDFSRKGDNSRNTKQLKVRLDLIVKSSFKFSSLFERIIVALKEKCQYSRKLVNELKKDCIDSVHMLESVTKNSSELKFFKVLVNHCINCFDMLWLNYL